ncbi:MAG: hypothetical protein ACHQ4H_01640 [Ktedonobacterales bacterium]
MLAQLPAPDRELLTYRLFRNASLAETAARMRLTTDEALASQWSALLGAAQIAANATAVASGACTAADGVLSCR